jgi:hypothetical protein
LASYGFRDRIKWIIEGSNSRIINILAWLPIIPAVSTAPPFTAFLTDPAGIAAIRAPATKAAV